MVKLNASIFFVLASILCTFSVYAFSGAGSGTAASPYNITNCTQLQEVNSSLTSTYQLVNNINCTATIGWNSGTGFKAIGSSGNGFSGVFNGKGYSISNLYINSTSWGALFAKTWKATIKNVNLNNSNITAVADAATLVGYAYSTNITNVTSSGVVSSDSSQVGGLVGYLDGYSGYSSITNSYTSVEIRVSAGVDSVGGLIGWCDDSVVNNTYSTGAVITSDTSTGVGGLIGYASASNIFYSYSTSSITGLYSVGGLVGECYYTNGHGNIDQSFSTGKVNTTTESAWGVGGLVGFNECVINRSYSSSNVYSDGWVGGLVGYNTPEGNITDSYSTSNITSVYADGGWVGGLIGINDDSVGVTASVTNSYSTGLISVQNLSNHIGGLIGQNVGGIITNSFWDMNTSNMTTSDGGVGKTTQQMVFNYSNESTFSAWNLGYYLDLKTWNHDWTGTQNRGYPMLRWSYLYLAQEIDNCTTLNNNVTYILTGDINATKNDCLSITGLNTNAVLDCGNHQIDGMGMYTRLISASTKNVNIQNCKVTNWGTTSQSYSVGIYQINDEITNLINITLNDTNTGINDSSYGIYTTSYTTASPLIENYVNINHLSASTFPLDCVSIFSNNVMSSRTMTINNSRLGCYVYVDSGSGIFTVNLNNVSDYDNHSFVAPASNSILSNMDNISEIILSSTTNVTITNITSIRNTYSGPLIFMSNRANETYISDITITNGTRGIGGRYGGERSIAPVSYFKNIAMNNLRGEHIDWWWSYGVSFYNITINSGNVSKTNLISLYTNDASNTSAFFVNSTVNLNYSDITIPTWSGGSAQDSMIIFSSPGTGGNYNVYNNYFKINKGNYYRGYYSNTNLSRVYLNTSIQTGRRIFGAGALIGGNYYANLTGGPSIDCADADRNGICDASLDFVSGALYDYAPLSDGYDNILPSYTDDTYSNILIQYGTQVNFSINLVDDYHLSSYRFGWNDSGSWVNNSWTQIVTTGEPVGTVHNIQTAKTVTSKRGVSVCRQYWFNDSYGNYNQTTVACFTVNNTLAVFAQTISSYSLYHNQNLSLQLNATDVDGDPLVWATNDSMITINQSGYLSDNPSQLDVGNHSIKVNVTDGYSVVNMSFNYEVINRPPSSGAVELRPIVATDINTLNCTTITAPTDQDDDPMAYAYNWYNNTIITVLHTFSIGAGNITTGQRWQCEMVTNDGLESISAFSQEVVIGMSDRAPTINNTNATTALTGIISNSTNPTRNDSYVNLSITFADNVGDNFTVHFCKTSLFSGSACSGGTYCNSTANITSTTFSCRYDLNMETTASKNYWGYIVDSSGLTNNIPGTFAINYPPPIPALSPGNATWINVNHTILTATSTDPDGDLVTYSIYSNTSINLTLVNTTTTNFNFTGLNETMYYWQVIANDSHGYESTPSLIYQFGVDWTPPILENQSITPDPHYTDSATNVYVDCGDSFSGPDISSLYYNITDAILSQSTQSMAYVVNNRFMDVYIHLGFPGVYVVNQFYCKDKAGNSVNQSSTMNFTTELRPVLGSSSGVTIVAPATQPVLNYTLHFRGDGVCECYPDPKNTTKTYCEDPGNTPVDCKIDFDNLLSCTLKDPSTCFYSESWFVNLLLWTIIAAALVITFLNRRKE
jgi:hypothetical protein